MSTLKLPQKDGQWHTHRVSSIQSWHKPTKPFRSRTVFAAAHIITDPFGENTPGLPAKVDWDSTLAFRRHLFEYGFGVAEAMDTAQRGMGLDWKACKELIARSSIEAKAAGARIASGVGTDQLDSTISSCAEIKSGYEEQLEYVESVGSQAILMASRQLAKVAEGPDDYFNIYSDLIRQAKNPVILHWLGTAFDPALKGYWGNTDISIATDVFLSIIKENPNKVDGVKVSLLDANHERNLRKSLPEGVRLYTGDDFNYPELILGEDGYHSDALLGIFAAIAPIASAALQALEVSDLARYSKHMDSTLKLSRLIFEAPTNYYKVGIAFISWLSDHQSNFTMVGGIQSGRSALHLSEVYRLADEIGLFPSPELAAQRMNIFLKSQGLYK